MLELKHMIVSSVLSILKSTNVISFPTFFLALSYHGYLKSGRIN